MIAIDVNSVSDSILKELEVIEIVVVAPTNVEVHSRLSWIKNRGCAIGLCFGIFYNLWISSVKCKNTWELVALIPRKTIEIEESPLTSCSSPLYQLHIFTCQPLLQMCWTLCISTNSIEFSSKWNNRGVGCFWLFYSLNFV